MAVRARSIRSTLALTALGLASLALAGPASAAPPKFESNSVTLKSSNGYRLSIFAFSGNLRKAPVGTVGIEASKNHALTDYEAQGNVTARRLKADLGEFGKVNLRFHPKKTTHPKPRRHCHGTTTLKRGIWKGKVVFRGENGYARASASQAPGYHASSTVRCGGGGGGPRTEVQLGADGDGGHFGASELKSGGKPDFFSNQFAVIGGVSVFRSADVQGKRRQFTWASDYSHAVVDPPKPFSGTATFDNGNWSGNLTVSYPGLRHVPLTGPSYTAQLGEVTLTPLGQTARPYASPLRRAR